MEGLLARGPINLQLWRGGGLLARGSNITDMEGRELISKGAQYYRYGGEGDILARGPNIRDVSFFMRRGV